MAASLTPLQAATVNEDWARTRHWDVRTADGSPATTLPQTADALGVTVEEAARIITSTPAGVAAPPALRRAAAKASAAK